MPNFDGTGPRSAGPMTGRGMGRCQVRGQGRGRCCPFNETTECSTQKEKIETLKALTQNILDEIELLEKETKND